MTKKRARAALFVPSTVRAPDPFDLEAMERSLNDSATRVSTIWVTFLLFGVYLTTSAYGITHRQMFLEEPIKVLFLNVDLPPFGFLFFGPLLFVTLHMYLVVHIVFLARTAAAYNQTLARRVTRESHQLHLRNRVANTLFAKFFAGDPRDRGNLLGSLVKWIAFGSLIFPPVFVLLILQYKFLPAHRVDITWSHRSLVLLDLLIVGVLSLLGSRNDNALGNTSDIFIAKPKALGAAFSFVVFVSVVVLAFPGEPHSNWLKKQLFEEPNRPKSYYECRRIPLLHGVLFDWWFDRLIIRPSDRGPHESERLRHFAARDLTCAELRGLEAPRWDFSAANLRGAILDYANLEGSIFAFASLHGASLQKAKLVSAVMEHADLSGANLTFATLTRARLNGASLPAATMTEANLEGASLVGANLRAASLGLAVLDGADLRGSQLQAAGLGGSSALFANFGDARLQGAYLGEARFDGADFSRARVQGAEFPGATLADARFDTAGVWGATGANCETARVVNPILARPEKISALIAEVVQSIPGFEKARVRTRLEVRLSNLSPEELERVDQKWRACSEHK